MSTSKLQNKTKLQLRLLLSRFEIVENFRPNWLKNPITGRNLEIDLYLPDVKIGIEVQGEQHDRFIPVFHASIEGFEYQQQKDRIKKDLCEKNGVYLYEVRSIDDIACFIENVRFHNQEIGYELYKKQTAIISMPYLMANYAKSNKPDQKTSIMKKMIHIVEKYQLSIESFKPNFDITKYDMTYALKPRIQVFRPSDIHPGKISIKKAILVKHDNNIARVLIDLSHGTLKEFHFDLETCEQIEPAKNPYKIMFYSLPEKLQSFRINNISEVE